MKRQAVDWEKIFEIHIPNEGLISKIYKEFTIQYQEYIQFNLKLAKYLNRCFTKEHTQMVNGHIEIYSLSLDILKKQIKITTRYHYMSTRITRIQKTDDNAGEDEEQLKVPYHRW